ncbi:MAG: BatD family protein [Phycisphaerales bacterium]
MPVQRSGWRHVRAMSVKGLGAWFIAVVAIVGALALAPSSFARAGTATFDIGPRETFVGVPVTVRVEVRNASSHDPPSVPTVPGATVDMQTPQQSSFTSIVNGRRTDLATVVYVFRITPTTPGEITVPAIAVTVDGRRFTSEATKIAVKPAESDDRLLVELLTDRKNPWVGEGVDVTLRIWIKPYLDQAASLRLRPETMWELLDDATQWGAFEQQARTLQQRQQAPNAARRNHTASDGKTSEYFVYELTKRIFPTRAGPLDVGDVAIRLRYPRRIEERRDFFGSRLVVADSVPVVALLGNPGIVVRALPEEGRPAAFRGAVGQFEIESKATPTDAAVGEPITLALTINDRTVGGSDLASLAPPPLAEQPDLVSEFRIASDPLAGDVQGWQKTVTQTIRARRDDATRIPPIDFAFFDPARGAYRVTRSKPIAVTIRAATGVDPATIVDARAPRPRERHGRRSRGDEPLQSATGGVVANELDPGATACTQTLGLGPVGTAAALVLPLAFLALIAIRLVRDRDRRDPAARDAGAPGGPRFGASPHPPRRRAARGRSRTSSATSRTRAEHAHHRGVARPRRPAGRRRRAVRSTEARARTMRRPGVRTGDGALRCAAGAGRRVDPVAPRRGRGMDPIAAIRDLPRTARDRGRAARRRAGDGGDRRMIHDLARSPVARLAAMRALALLVFLVPASLSNAAASASTAVDARGGAPVAARAEVPSIVAAAQAAYDRGIARAATTPTRPDESSSPRRRVSRRA